MKKEFREVVFNFIATLLPVSLFCLFVRGRDNILKWLFILMIYYVALQMFNTYKIIKKYKNDKSQDKFSLYFNVVLSICCLIFVPIVIIV